MRETVIEPVLIVSVYPESTRATTRHRGNVTARAVKETTAAPETPAVLEIAAHGLRGGLRGLRRLVEQRGGLDFDRKQELSRKKVRKISKTADFVSGN